MVACEIFLAFHSSLALRAPTMASFWSDRVLDFFYETLKRPEHLLKPRTCRPDVPAEPSYFRTALALLTSAADIPGCSVDHHLSYVGAEQQVETDGGLPCLAAEADESLSSKGCLRVGCRECGGSTAEIIESVGEAAATFEPYLWHALSCIRNFATARSPQKPRWSLEQIKVYILVLKMAMWDHGEGGAETKPVTAEGFSVNSTAESAAAGAGAGGAPAAKGGAAAAERVLLSKVRGPAGESLLHFTLLMGKKAGDLVGEEAGRRTYELALWLLELEPMLLKTRYTGPEYKGENALHILCSNKELPTLRKVAKRALFYEHTPQEVQLKGEEGLYSGLDRLVGQLAPDTPKMGGKDQSFHVLRALKNNMLNGTWKNPGSLDTGAIELACKMLCEMSWRLVKDCEDMPEALTSPWTICRAVGESAEETAGKRGVVLDMAAVVETEEAAKKKAAEETLKVRRGWMRRAWSRAVNGIAHGTFFEPPELGGSCYYGGTPVAISTVMGDVDTIRFLTLEVGCRDLICWDVVEQNGAHHLYADSLDPNDTRLGDPKSGRFASSQLLNWDPVLCARFVLLSPFTPSLSTLKI